MIPQKLDMWDPRELQHRVKEVGADLRSVPYFMRKRGVLCLRLGPVDFRAANALKQELLARGGDAVVHGGAIAGTVDRTRVILMGTPGQLHSLQEKLAHMPYFGLEEVRSGLKAALDNLDISNWEVPLPGGRVLSLGRITKVMGIINLTPDSFFPGSRHQGPDGALETAERMLSQGAHVLDLGAESTRPGSDPVSPEEELTRMLPPLRAIRREFPEAVISVDTYRSATARACAAEGADMVNDISGLSFDPEMARTVADSGCALVLMHIKGRPKDMQQNPTYRDLLGEISDFFERQMDLAERGGIPRDRIILDPGIGFGKTYQHNLEILRQLEAFSTHGRPILIGASRKSTVGIATDSKDPEDRLEGTLAITSLCAMRGIALVRVHDVEENVKTIKMIEAVKEAGL
ncbi:dihydropteroate synthase [Thermanaerovibrio acidaminovorans]|uniref:dihydropteroate synthase n=2 Tax=Thermanaerovibrio acidaminovorans TaxID=81462 RepID=UPI00249077CB|nr:dihydropteroate synthase [Thermanaerovibrio acidaminovorans]